MRVPFRAGLAVQILAGVAFVLAALCCLVCVIGYREFTVAIARQYEDSVWRTARMAASVAPPDFLAPDGRDDAERRTGLLRLEEAWTRLADAQDATFIYVIQPERPDYRRIRFVLSVMNSSARYERFPGGHVRPTMDEEHRRAYIALCEGRAERATIVRDRGSIDTGHHISVLIPLRDRRGAVAGLLGVQRQMAELQAARGAYVRHVLTAAGLLLSVVLLAYGRHLNRNLLAPIQRISREALRFARENTPPDVPLARLVRTGNEIGRLARTIDRMEADIRDHIANLAAVTAEKERIGAELDVAARIQADMLPRVLPPFPERKEVDIAAAMTPAQVVGGDFYDFFLIDDDHLGLVMADVSGKGVPAALFMVVAKTLIKSRAQMGGSPARALEDVNERLCEGNEAAFFVTVWLGVLEISTGRLVAANAGHEYPAVRRAGGAWELVKVKPCPAVATMEGLRFRENEFELRPGDSLCLYTDGVAEAVNADEAFFGRARLLEALNRRPEGGAEEIILGVTREVDAFVGDAPQFDDITMLALRYFGAGPDRAEELTLEARIENLAQALAFIDERLEARACGPKVRMRIDVATEEIFVNIARYAYAPDTGPVTIRLAIRDGAAVITFIDRGVPYNPLDSPEPDLALPLEERPIGGLGVHLVKKSMDSVAYEYKDGRNVFVMRKAL